jgi:hypothetical protein
MEWGSIIIKTCGGVKEGEPFNQLPCPPAIHNIYILPELNQSAIHSTFERVGNYYCSKNDEATYTNKYLMFLFIKWNSV